MCVCTFLSSAAAIVNVYFTVYRAGGKSDRKRGGCQKQNKNKKETGNLRSDNNLQSRFMSNAEGSWLILNAVFSRGVCVCVCIWMYASVCIIAAQKKKGVKQPVAHFDRLVLSIYLQGCTRRKSRLHLPRCLVASPGSCSIIQLCCAFVSRLQGLYCICQSQQERERRGKKNAHFVNAPLMYSAFKTT